MNWGLRIAIVRALKHEKVIYQCEDVERGKRELAAMRVPEELKQRIIVSNSFTHIPGFNRKAIIREGRWPTGKDATKWAKLERSSSAESSA